MIQRSFTVLFSVCLSRGSEQLYGERTGERREVGQADGWMERAGEMRMERGGPPLRQTPLFIPMLQKSPASSLALMLKNRKE